MLTKAWHTSFSQRQVALMIGDTTKKNILYLHIWHIEGEMETPITFL